MNNMNSMPSEWDFTSIPVAEHPFCWVWEVCREWDGIDYAISRTQAALRTDGENEDGEDYRMVPPNDEVMSREDFVPMIVEYDPERWMEFDLGAFIYEEFDKLGRVSWSVIPPEQRARLIEWKTPRYAMLELSGRSVKIKGEEWASRCRLQHKRAAAFEVDMRMSDEEITHEFRVWLNKNRLRPSLHSVDFEEKLMHLGSLRLLRSFAADEVLRMVKRYPGAVGFKDVDAVRRAAQQANDDIMSFFPNGKLRFRDASFAAVRGVEAGSPDRYPCTQGSTWPDVHIRFQNGHEALVKVERQGSPGWARIHYSTLGLRDGRTGDPSEAWKFFQRLAEGRGFVPRDRDKEAMEQRKKELSKALKNYFQIAEDPLPHTKRPEEAGYRAAFLIEPEGAE